MKSNCLGFKLDKVMNGVGKKLFNNTVRMEIQPAVTWFYKEITFFKSGIYRIYAYDEKDKLIGLGEVKINLR